MGSACLYEGQGAASVGSEVKERSVWGQCRVRRTCMRVKDGSVRGQTYLYEGQCGVRRTCMRVSVGSDVAV